jgi:hypothetical protein
MKANVRTTMASSWWVCVGPGYSRNAEVAPFRVVVQVDMVLDLLGESLGGGELLAEGLDAGLSGGAENAEPVLQPAPLAAVRGGQVVEDLQQVAHLLQGESERFHPLHHAEPVQIGFGVEPEPALTVRGRQDKTGVFVVADGADAQPDPFGGLADLVRVGPRRPSNH